MPSLAVEGHVLLRNMWRCGRSSERRPPVEQPQREARASGRVRAAPVREAGTGWAHLTSWPV